jgi:hypothetical protein
LADQPEKGEFAIRNNSAVNTGSLATLRGKSRLSIPGLEQARRIRIASFGGGGNSAGQIMLDVTASSICY